MAVNLVKELLSKIEKKRRSIVVLGDVMTDRWVHGSVSQCQDGCPKFVQDRVVDVPGGAANARRSLDRWNITTHLCGRNGEIPIKCRYVDSNNKILFRSDSGEGLPCDYSRVHSLAMEMVGCVDGVLLSDYDKGMLTHEFIRGVSDLCRKRGIPCVADAKQLPRIYKGLVLKGNFDYLERYSDNIEFSSDVVITRGASSPIIRKYGMVVNVGVDFSVVCINHVGAGDCFAAHLLLAMVYGFSLVESATLAYSAGRVYVQHLHNRPPTPSEVAADLNVQ